VNKQIENAPTVTCEKNATGFYTCAADERVDVGILLELGSIGSGHAATSLSEILQQQVLIDIPRINVLPTHQIAEFYGRHDAPTTAVYIRLTDSQCDMLLVFEAAEAKRIAAMMTMAPSIGELDPAMEKSAIQELANIVIGSFLTAISDFTGVPMLPTTPELAEDTFDTIIDSFVIKQAMASNEALVFDTHFRRDGEEASSILMIFPSPQLQELLVQKSKELIETPTGTE